MKGFRLAVFAVLAAAIATSSCDNDPIRAGKTTPLPDGPDTLPPPGFVGFCMHWPQACINRGGTAKLTLDKHVARTIVQVNAFVNRSIRYESSMDQYGVANRWTLDALGGYGNCEDYSVVKRELLRAEGLPDRVLRIAVVQTPENEYHAVLTVDTDRGVLVLDSATPKILGWSNTPYTWLKRQAADDPLHWVTLNTGGQ